MTTLIHDLQAPTNGMPTYRGGDNYSHQQVGQTHSERNMAIAGLIAAFVVPPVGLVLSIIALLKSKRAGYKNNLAIGGIVVSALLTIAAIVVLALLLPFWAQCQELGAGIHQLDNRMLLECTPRSFNLRVGRQ